MAEEQPKIGAGHASAMFRLGLRELRAVFFPESNVAQQSEYGVVGTRTPGEVAAGRRMDANVQRLEQEPPVRSPSEIAAAARGGQGNVGPAERSPGQVAADARGGVQGPERPHGHEHEMGHEL